MTITEHAPPRHDSAEATTPSPQDGPPAAAPPTRSRAPRPRVRERAAGRAAVVRDAVAAGPDDGMATAEYAIATIAAVGFAGLLIAVLKSEAVKGLLAGIISSALSIG